MKTAEQWNEEWKELSAKIDQQYNTPESNLLIGDEWEAVWFPHYINLLKQIQLDAFKAGMIYAAMSEECIDSFVIDVAGELTVKKMEQLSQP